KYGCTDTANIEVLHIDGAKFKSPNAFSPNGDGNNDCYSLMLPIIPLEYELMIFNRWGNKVFATNNINECWDGNYKGAAQPGGVYVYYYKLTSTDCGEVSNKGNITLVR